MPAKKSVSAVVSVEVSVGGGLIGDGDRRRLGEVGDVDVRALGGEAKGDRAPHPRAAADDRGDPAFEPARHVLFP